MRHLLRFQKIILFFLIPVFCFQTGCAHVPRAKVPLPPAKVPKKLLDYYRYTPLKTEPRVSVVGEGDHYVEKQVVFDSVEDTGGRRLPLVIRFYEPKAEEGPHPLVLITPILGKKYEIEQSFAEFFANQGYACAIVHRKRLRLLPNEDLSQIEDYLRSSVIRLRMAIDWLEKQEKVNPNAIGTFGISFGGALNTILGGIEPRTKCHIIALAGGPIADVIIYSHERTIRRYRNQFMKLRGIDEEQLRRRLHASLISDPIQFANFVDARNVFLFIAMFDMIVGRKHARKLAKAFGYPKSYYVPLGHYTATLAIPFVRVKAAQFLDSNLKEPPPPNREP